MSLRARIEKARVATAPAQAQTARGGLLAFVGAKQGQGATEAEIADTIASGAAAQGIAGVALQSLSPRGLACTQGCAFCCILRGEDGGTITEAEARGLHAALAPLKGAPDGRSWAQGACAALDPETRSCRAYAARPMICRTYVSSDVSACEKVAEGQAAEGPGTLGPYHTYLAALGLSRAALKGVRRVATYSLSKLTAAAIDGMDTDAALAAARHKPAGLDDELRRSKRDLERARQAGL